MENSINAEHIINEFKKRPQTIFKLFGDLNLLKAITNVSQNENRFIFGCSGECFIVNALEEIYPNVRHSLIDSGTSSVIFDAKIGNVKISIKLSSSTDPNDIVFKNFQSNNKNSHIEDNIIFIYANIANNKIYIFPYEAVKSNVKITDTQITLKYKCLENEEMQKYKITVEYTDNQEKIINHIKQNTKVDNHYKKIANEVSSKFDEICKSFADL